jgi:subtilisin-like proprotein convertase family protein
MKKSTLIGMMAALLATVMNAGASLYPIGSIPDGSPVGVSFTGTYDGAASGATVGSLTVNLSISGGYNGNLYGYLVAPNGTLALLLNQPGVTGGNPFGYAGSGLNVTLTDATTLGGNPVTGIQTTTETPGQLFSGTYNAAGTLGTFNNSSANGEWTLFFADMTPGGGQAQLTGWSLGITAVPEPVNVAMVIFGVGFVGMGAVRYARQAA